MRQQETYMVKDPWLIIKWPSFFPDLSVTFATRIKLVDLFFDLLQCITSFFVLVRTHYTSFWEQPTQAFLHRGHCFHPAQCSIDIGLYLGRLFPGELEWVRRIATNANAWKLLSCVLQIYHLSKICCFTINEKVSGEQ